MASFFTYAHIYIVDAAVTGSGAYTPRLRAQSKQVVVVEYYK